MRITDIFKESWHALTAHKLRSLLTVLGIVIGVFAVSLMLSIGQGVQQLINNEIQSFSQGDVVIISQEVPLNDRNLQWLRNKQYADFAVGYINENIEFTVEDQKFNPNLNFINGPFDRIRNIRVQEGQSLDWSDNTDVGNIVVVDSQFAKKFLEKTNRPVYPGTLNIRGTRYTVQGVINTGSGIAFGFGDGEIYMPYQLASSQFNKLNYTSIALKLKDVSRYEVVIQHIRENFNAWYGFRLDDRNKFEINSDQTFIQQEQRINRYLGIFLGVIGGIALLVGGIGTMNMMLTTVTERTKEIGLRKAVGAHDRDITLQILCESMLLTGFGGITGVALTYTITLLANTILTIFVSAAAGFVLVVNSFVVALSVLISIMIGIVFGWSPAKKAARLPVVDALRSD